MSISALFELEVMQIKYKGGGLPNLWRIYLPPLLKVHRLSVTAAVHHFALETCPFNFIQGLKGSLHKLCR